MMEPVTIAAIITGICGIIASIIAKSNKKKKEETEIIEVHVKPEKELIIPPTPNRPVFLNPDDYDIDDEDFIITLGGLLQQSRNPKDVSVKIISKHNVGETKK